MGIKELSFPYGDFDADRYPLDLYGWGSDAPIFEKFVTHYRPSLIIEVGTWKGASALHMAKFLPPGAKIVCVDTWLGALEFWRDQTDSTRYQSLRRHYGYPQVYYQFLANVVKLGFQDTIIPFPQTSLIAARWFLEQRVRSSMIYIDGSHDYEDVAADIKAYWPLVLAGGVLFGDDYDWDGVGRAVRDSGISFSLEGRTWIMQK